jgi:hypothetical protein
LFCLCAGIDKKNRTILIIFRHVVKGCSQSYVSSYFCFNTLVIIWWKWTSNHSLLQCSLSHNKLWEFRHNLLIYVYSLGEKVWSYVCSYIHSFTLSWGCRKRRVGNTLPMIPKDLWRWAYLPLITTRLSQCQYQPLYR